MKPINILVYFLVFFFILLIFYQIFASINLLEGFEGEIYNPESSTSSSGEYKNYKNDDIATLAHQNAGNIQVMKKQMDELYAGKDQVKKNTENIVTLQTQVNTLMQTQSQPAADMTKKTPTITGT